MKARYDWMNDGKEFEMPDFNSMNPQEQIDILTLKIRAEKKFNDLKPDGIRPKDNKDLTDDWTLYLNMVAMQHNLDIVAYALRTVDPKTTKEIVMKHLKTNKQIAEILNQLFRVGTKNPRKKTGGQLKSKS